MSNERRHNRDGWVLRFKSDESFKYYDLYTVNGPVFVDRPHAYVFPKEEYAHAVRGGDQRLADGEVVSTTIDAQGGQHGNQAA